LATASPQVAEKSSVVDRESFAQLSVASPFGMYPALIVAQARAWRLPGESASAFICASLALDWFQYATDRRFLPDVVSNCNQIFAATGPAC
jgi:hypothetical protein